MIMILPTSADPIWIIGRMIIIIIFLSDWYRQRGTKYPLCRKTADTVDNSITNNDFQLG